MNLDDFLLKEFLYYRQLGLLWTGK